MLELISSTVNLRLADFNYSGAWFIHFFCSFYSLESSVLSVENILARGGHAWRYKQRIHRTERPKIGEQQLRIRMIMILHTLLLLFVLQSAVVVNFVRETGD